MTRLRSQGRESGKHIIESGQLRGFVSHGGVIQVIYLEDDRLHAAAIDDVICRYVDPHAEYEKRLESRERWLKDQLETLTGKRTEATPRPILELRAKKSPY